jgi:hypothetical protein
MGGVFFELFQQYACDAVSDAELAVEFINEIKQKSVCGHVAFLGDFSTYLLIFLVVEVVVIVIKDSIVSNSVGLMNLKIETD